MNKFEAIQKNLAEVFDKFESFFQLELNPHPEILITDYKGQSYIILSIQLSDSQCSIIKNNIPTIIDFDDTKVFKILNTESIGFIPIDGKTGLLGFGDSHCDFIFFDNEYFCFIEFKLNATSQRKIEKNRKKAIKQLENTINLFDQKLARNYQQFNLEAYICTPDTYPRDNTSWKKLAQDFLENNEIPLFEAKEKNCQSFNADKT